MLTSLNDLISSIWDSVKSNPFFIIFSICSSAYAIYKIIKKLMGLMIAAYYFKQFPIKLWFYCSSISYKEARFLKLWIINYSDQYSDMIEREATKQGISKVNMKNKSSYSEEYSMFYKERSIQDQLILLSLTKKEILVNGQRSMFGYGANDHAYRKLHPKIVEILHSR